MKEEASTISTSLSSIIRKQLIKHEADVRLRQRSRPAARLVIKKLESEQYPDDRSIKAAKERLYIWNREIRWFELLGQLADAIDSNPFPGYQMKLTDIAVRLFPHVCKREWREAFFWYELNYYERYTFPVIVKEFDVEQLEWSLHELMKKDGHILASALVQVLNSPINSKQYRVTKKLLEGRGWEWIARRIEGRMTKVVIPPG